MAAAMAGRGKSLMSAAVVASSANSEIDPQKKRSMAAKVMKMKEDITREVVQRTAAMADREERAVLRMDTFCTGIHEGAFLQRDTHTFTSSFSRPVMHNRVCFCTRVRFSHRC